MSVSLDSPALKQPAAAAVGASSRYVTLDHWRGLACLLVVVYHATIVALSNAGTAWSAGPLNQFASGLIRVTHTFNVGVALFFVISGYCIAAAADGVRQRPNRPVSQYFVRRFRRIYPPFWIVVGASVAFFAVDYWPWPGLLSEAPWAQLRPQWYAPSQWFGNLTLTETWRSHVFGAQRGHFPGQAWTLCYEEQFYAVMGVLLFLRERFFAGVLVVTLGSGAIAASAARFALPVSGFFFDGAWLLFAAGVGVYYVIRRRTGVGPAWLWVTSAGLAGLLLAPSVPVAGASLGFVFAALLWLLHPYDAQLAGLPLFRWLAYPGQMCYSLYLVHQIPVKAVSAGLHRAGLTDPVSTLALTVPACVLTSLVLGRWFYVAVERHFLNAPQDVTGVRFLGRRAAVSHG